MLALAAPLDPEKVQLLALLARLGASVMAGSATGDAIADTAHVTSARDPRILDIVVLLSGSTASCSPLISVLMFGFHGFITHFRYMAAGLDYPTSNNKERFSISSNICFPPIAGVISSLYVFSLVLNDTV